MQDLGCLCNGAYCFQSRTSTDNKFTRTRHLLSKVFVSAVLSSAFLIFVKMTLPQCRVDGCHRRVPSKRSKLCLACRRKKAVVSGGLSKGNCKKDSRKAMAGRRSGVKRSTKNCLVVKKTWLDLILAGAKDWEIRGCKTSKRGWIHFAESGAGGRLVGRARLVDCQRIDKHTFTRSFTRHRIPAWAQVKYKQVYAWVLENVQAFEKPFKYKHKLGAVIWVRFA